MFSLSNSTFRILIISILLIFAAPVCHGSKISPSGLGTLPIQNISAGETHTIPLNRFLTENNSTLPVFGNIKGVNLSFSADKSTLYIYPSPDISGLLDIPVTLPGGDGQRKSLSVLTLSVSRRSTHMFKFRPESPLSSVSVAGSFNGWNAARNPLSDPDNDGTYSVEVKIEPGEHLYKFVVDGKWMADPANPNRVPDGFGGYNSVLTVVGDVTQSPPLVIPLISTESSSRFRIIGDGKNTVSVVVENPDGTSFIPPYSRKGSLLDVPHESLEKGAWIRISAGNENGLLSSEIRFQPKQSDNFVWEDAVIYFAFTDRFKNGSIANDSPTHIEGLEYPASWHGGDWIGIRQKIEDGYFSDLGINVLWISPLNKNPEGAFKSYIPPHRLYTGYHGYWPVSPNETDPRFGSKDDLKRLVESAHHKNIKVIADLVLNHVHETHPFYRTHPDWFAPLTLPDGRKNLRLWDEHPYTTWFEPFLPSFDFNNPEVGKVLIQNSLWWAREFNLDGFRLDAVKHIPVSFWTRFARSIRSELGATNKPRFLLLGETFLDRQGIMSFVGPALLDGQFDFPLYETIKSVFALRQSGFDSLESSLRKSEKIYGKQTARSTLLGNHDKARFMAYADGDLPSPDEPNEEEAGWNDPPTVDDPSSYDFLKMGFAFLFTNDGIPMIYYGDEWGMTGAADPDNRRDMRFPEKLDSYQKSTLETVKELIRFRKDHPASRYGIRVPLLVEKDQYVYARRLFDDQFLVVFNRSSSPVTVDFSTRGTIDDSNYADIFSDLVVAVNDGNVSIPLPPRSFTILTPSTRKVSLPQDNLPQSRYKSVALAGTFNNWNVNDSEYAMRLNKEGKWEIQRYFPAGNHTFKFVMNGSWDIHRGMGESRWNLVQPGQDIPLNLETGGYYRILVEPNTDRWSLEKTAGPTALAEVNLEEYYPFGKSIVIDASSSLPRQGKEIKKYVLTQSPEDEVVIEELPLETSNPLIRFTAPMTGLYHLKLHVNDGVPGKDKEFTIQVKPSSQLIFSDGRVLELSPRGNSLFHSLLSLPPSQTLDFYVTEDHSANKLGANERLYLTDFTRVRNLQLVPDGKEISFKSPSPLVLQLEYDRSSKMLKIQKSNMTGFFFDEKGFGQPVRSVALAGSFNNWNTKSDLLKRDPDGVWRTYLKLEPGRYAYKFVINGDRWVEDPNADPSLRSPDGHGGFNSGIIVGERGEMFGKARTQFIVSKAVLHDPEDIRYFNPFSKSLSEIKIRVLKDDLEDVFLLYRGSGGIIETPLFLLSSDLGFDYYGTYLSLPEQGAFSYCFKLKDGPTVKYLSGAGLSERIPDQDQWFRPHQQVRFKTPDWAKNVVWYQIMLDRWRNGDTSNDPDLTLPWGWDWYKPFTEGEKRSFYGPDGVWHRYFGGDLQGMMETLDYLENLGITAIYFNPIFEADSHHKYNTTDYRHIDDNFGYKGDIRELGQSESEDPATWRWTKTDRLFLDFLKAAHQRGFYVIIDGVFNHSGTNFWAFQDIIKNKQRSRYKDWFVIKKWGLPEKWPGGPTFSYDGWAGFDSLPEYAEDAYGLVKGPREHIFNITRRWMDPNGDGNPSDGIDGWRLDVPGNVAHPFWKDWRKLVREINPEGYITGEIWDNAKPWLQGDEFDAVMNYEFTKLVYQFFLPGGTTRAISAEEFGEKILEILNWYPPQVNMVLQNLLSSHDVDRISSAILNRAGWKQGRVQDQNPNYNTGPPTEKDYEILKLIYTFQMTHLGAPMNYYGDEVGMFGADDPSDRMPMWWDDLMPYDNPSYKIHKDLLEHFRLMVAIRNSFPALRTGLFRLVKTDSSHEIVVFERIKGNSSVYVVLNNSWSQQTVRFPVKEGAITSLLDVARKSNVKYVKKHVEGLRSSRNQVIPAPDAKLIKVENGYCRLTVPPKRGAVLVPLNY